MPTAVAHRVQQEQAAMTAEQSLVTVKKLVHTSLGILTYLRGVFPEENYQDEYVPSGRSNRKRDAIKVKTIRRGYSREADMLLDYWEQGVVDALEKGYLANIIFAIYLDPNDPCNIVEAYTFNFTYHAIPSSDAKIPVMEVHDKLRGLRLGQSAEPFKFGEKSMPTVKDVRSSVQALIRTLITLTQSMTELPRKRYISLKMYYSEGTPESYEPRHFYRVDSEKNQFLFGTKELTEGPVQFRIGKVDTGHHGFSLHVASLADSLPPPIHYDDYAAASKLDPAIVNDKVVRRRYDDEQQAASAKERTVFWNAEEQALESDEDQNPNAIVPRSVLQETNRAVTRKNGNVSVMNQDVNEMLRRQAEGPKRCSISSFPPTQPIDESADVVLSQPAAGPAAETSRTPGPVSSSRDLGRQEEIPPATAADDETMPDIVPLARVQTPTPTRAPSRTTTRSKQLPTKRKASDSQNHYDGRDRHGQAYKGMATRTRAKRKCSMAPGIDIQVEEMEAESE